MDNAKDAARAHAVRLLARREHSAAELARKLIQRGHVPEIVNEVVEDLARRNWQDDARYVEVLTRYRHAAGYGPVRVLAELGQQGIHTQSSEVQAIIAALDWNEAALAAAQKKMRSLNGLGPKEKGRIQRHLAGRGFTSEHIRYALSSALGPL